MADGHRQDCSHQNPRWKRTLPQAGEAPPGKRTTPCRDRQAAGNSAAGRAGPKDQAVTGSSGIAEAGDCPCGFGSVDLED